MDRSARVERMRWKRSRTTSSRPTSYRRQLGTLDAEWDAVGQRAARLLTTAANEALEREDLAAAGSLATRALDRLDADAPERADLLLLGSEALLSSGDATGGRPLVDELELVAAGHERLTAWAACFRGQLSNLTEPDALPAADRAVAEAAEVLERLDDQSGVAKARLVHAGTVARLGRIGECEAELDLALGAARAADDRRRITAVLGSAPLAALWGPSPVPRAGGRCLDVIRLLRVTTGSRAVEATSVRSQGVLEALRGRFDTARSMLGQSREWVEELGLRQGLMETELFSGIVELMAGDPVAAEPHLRAAYGGLGAMGVGADAGQAAALLARSLLSQGRVDEADEPATASEAMAGQNLKTAIAWRSVRAEIEAATGDADLAIALAEEAVKIAAGTDLVVDHLDACLALARVRQIAGDEAGARQAQDQAKTLYEAKGATAMGPAPVARTSPAPAMSGVTGGGPSNQVVKSIAEATRAQSDTEFEEWFDSVHPDFVRQDRRSVIGLPDLDKQGYKDAITERLAVGLRVTEARSLATRGDRLALMQTVQTATTGDTSAALVVAETDSDGLMIRQISFDVDDLDAALAELDRLYLAGDGAAHADIWQPLAECGVALSNAELDRAMSLIHEDFVAVDHRLASWPELDKAGLRERWATMGPGRVLPVEIFTLKAHGAVARSEWQPAGEGIAASSIGMVTFRDGQWARTETFELDDLDAALARFAELDPDRESTPASIAVERLGERAFALLAAGDHDAVAKLYEPGFVREDRRSLIGLPIIEGRDGAMKAIHAREGMGMRPVAHRTIAVRGERAALHEVHMGTDDGLISRMLSIVMLGESGLHALQITFDIDDLSAALEELDRLYLEGEAAEYAEIYETARQQTRGMNERDRNSLEANMTDDYVAIDHRKIGWPELDREGRLERYETLGPGLAVITEIHALARHGLVVAMEFRQVGAEFALGVLGLTIWQDGKFSREETFDPDDLDAALARFAELDPERAQDDSTAMTRFVERWLQDVHDGDKAAATEMLEPDFVREDRRSVIGLPKIEGRDLFMEALLAREETGLDQVSHRIVAVRGERLGIFELEMTAGESASTIELGVMELGTSGLSKRGVILDIDDLGDAQRQLDDWYLEGEAAEHADVWRATIDLIEPLSAGDVDSALDLLSDDFVAVDHREASWPELDREGMRKRWLTLPDGLLFVTRVHALKAHGAAFGFEFQPADGGFSPERINLVAFRDGKTCRIETFHADDLEAALARLAELA